MRLIPTALVIAVDYAILGLLVGLTLYAVEGSFVLAVVGGIGAAVIGATIDEDQKAHRDPHDEPVPRRREVLRDGFWPPAMATVLRRVSGWRQLGGVVFDYVAPPLILLPFALIALESDNGLREGIAVALVVFFVIRLQALVAAIGIYFTGRRTPRASSPERPGA